MGGGLFYTHIMAPQYTEGRQSCLNGDIMLKSVKDNVT